MEEISKALSVWEGSIAHIAEATEVRRTVAQMRSEYGNACSRPAPFLTLGKRGRKTGECEANGWRGCCRPAKERLTAAKRRAVGKDRLRGAFLPLA